MPTEIVVALIAGIAGIIGGLIGAIASPLGKDWVAHREFERKQRQQEQNRSRSARDQMEAENERIFNIHSTLWAKRCTTSIWHGVDWPHITPMARRAREPKMHGWYPDVSMMSLVAE